MNTKLQNAKTDQPELFEYENYREYLGDMYSFFKNTRRGFSYRAFSESAGFSSPNFLKLVIDGKRGLTANSCQKVMKALSFNKAQTEFFEALVNFTQARTSEEKSIYFDRMRKFKKFRNIKPVDADQYEYYSKWYYSIVRELLTLSDFKEDPAWISKRVFPNISEREAGEALELLQRLGLVVRESSGRLAQSDPSISTGPEVASLAVTQFHNQMFERASESIEIAKAELRDISSVTIGLKASELKAIKAKIYEFRKELLADVAKSSNANDEVYQLNIQFFPLTKKEGASK